jgi:hypothetical protein
MEAEIANTSGKGGLLKGINAMYQSNLIAYLPDLLPVPVSPWLPDKGEILSVYLLKEMYNIAYMFRCHTETGGTLKDDFIGPKTSVKLLGGLEGLKDFIGGLKGSIVLSPFLRNGLFEPTIGWAGRVMGDELPCFGGKFEALRSLLPPSISR